MTRALLIMIAVLAACVTGLLIAMAALRRKAAGYKEKAEENFKLYSEAVGKVSELNRTIRKLEAAAAIKDANRKEADEKIDALHDGDAVDNALDELRKR